MSFLDAPYKILNTIVRYNKLYFRHKPQEKMAPMEIQDSRKGKTKQNKAQNPEA